MRGARETETRSESQPASVFIGCSVVVHSVRRRTRRRRPPLGHADTATFAGPLRARRALLPPPGEAGMARRRARLDASRSRRRTHERHHLLDTAAPVLPPLDRFVSRGTRARHSGRTAAARPPPMCGPPMRAISGVGCRPRIASRPAAPPARCSLARLRRNRVWRGWSAPDRLWALRAGCDATRTIERRGYRRPRTACTAAGQVLLLPLRRRRRARYRAARSADSSLRPPTLSTPGTRRVYRALMPMCSGYWTPEGRAAAFQASRVTSAWLRTIPTARRGSGGEGAAGPRDGAVPG